VLGEVIATSAKSPKATGVPIINRGTLELSATHILRSGILTAISPESKFVGTLPGTKDRLGLNITGIVNLGF
jgi:hypothetical protein